MPACPQFASEAVSVRGVTKVPPQFDVIAEVRENAIR